MLNSLIVAVDCVEVAVVPPSLFLPHMSILPSSIRICQHVVLCIADAKFLQEHRIKNNNNNNLYFYVVAAYTCPAFRKSGKIRFFLCALDGVYVGIL